MTERPEAPHAVKIKTEDGDGSRFIDWLDQNSTDGWGIIQDHPGAVDFEFRFVSPKDAAAFAEVFSEN